MRRAGCRRTETTAHILQCCDRAADGRVKRHGAVIRCLADDLIKKGMRVKLEYLYSSSVGNRKPDNVAKDASGVVWVLDVQIVSALAGLGVAHRNKIEKYRGNSSLVDSIAGRARSGSRPSHSRGRECGGTKRWSPSSPWVYPKRL